MLARRTEFTVDRPLKVRLELIRFLDRHRHIAREIHVGRTTASFCDVSRYRVRRACDLIRKSAPLSCEQPAERGGFEGKHMGFLPDLKFSEIRHGRILSASPSSAVTILLQFGALVRGAGAGAISGSMSVSVKLAALSILELELAL